MKRALVIGLGVIWAVVSLTGCGVEDTRSSVPSYPVHITIDTRTGAYVHFKQDVLNDYIIVLKDGVYYHNLVYPRPVDMSYGYAGVVINVNINSQYSAFDLCCPVCLNKLMPIVVNGGYADCPTCGEAYELMNGMGTPSKGISREALRRYRTVYFDGVVQVTN